MPVNGLSLFGYFPEANGVLYVRQHCYPRNVTAQQAKQRWMAARGRLGDANPRAGQPVILDIPEDHRPYLARVKANPRYEETVRQMAASFKLVEIGPLLAFQVHIEDDRTANVCAGIASPPSVAEILPRCLPVAPMGPGQLPFDYKRHGGGNAGGYTVTCADKNLRVINWGTFDDPAGGYLYDPNQGVFVSGVSFGEGSSLVQVVRFRNRCFLKNGYHRALAIARHGATHIPCVFLDAADYAQVDGEPPAPAGRFGQTLLLGPNPPTLSHFIDGRATAVTLRSTKRVIRVTWDQQIIAD